MDELVTLLRSGVGALGMEPDPLCGRLSIYLRELQLWNPAYGLVNASGRDLVVKHLLDSLAPVPVLADLLADLDRREGRDAACIADLGTGAGLPGIPLALAFPGRRVHLVERMGKRVSFLRNQTILLGLGNASIVESEVEKAPGPYDLVVFRAFRPFTERALFRAVAKLLTAGGVVAAYKGRISNAREELVEIADDPVVGKLARTARIVPVRVPFLDEERCLVVLGGTGAGTEPEPGSIGG